MTPSEIIDARLAIGLAWGLKRPLQKAELGELLGYVSRDVGAAIADWETGRTRPPGPALTAIQALLDGWRPPGWQQRIPQAKRMPRMFDKNGKERAMIDILRAASKTKLKSDEVDPRKSLHVNFSPDQILRVFIDGVLVFHVDVAEAGRHVKISMPKD